MIAVDTSALMAVIREETDAARLFEIMGRQHVIAGAPTVVEFGIVVPPKRVPRSLRSRGTEKAGIRRG